MYKFFIISDNDPGVLAKLCNLFAARSINIHSLHTAPMDREEHLSSIELIVDMPYEKVENMSIKILSMVPIRDVKVFEEKEIFSV